MPQGIWKNGKDLQMRKNPGGMGVPASGIIASRDAVARRGGCIRHVSQWLVRWRE